jgi:uncharacterized membrane protein YheB (UPF0754 family)
VFEWLREPDFWRYASIPVIAGIIGYVTNWLAVRMTFRPIEFRGLVDPWLGWQGIIPSKSKKMAAIAVDASLAKLASLSEIFEHMDPERVGERLLETARERTYELTDEIMRETDPELWEELPEPARRAIAARVRERLPEALDDLVEDMSRHLDQLLDLRLMVVDRLAEDRTLLNRIFKEVGEEEFTFIIRSGAIFGFPFGLVQMLVWILVPQWWVLPAFGVGVGYATNWIALNLIFRPLIPVKLGPFVAHGLFLRRQDEVAEEFSRLVTREVLTIRNFVDAMLHGPRSDRTRALVRRHVTPIVDEAAGVARPAVEFTVGDREYARIKEQLSTRAIELSESALDDPVFNAERAVAVEQEMQARMRELSSAEFQDLLRPAFKEDELRLILVGAAIGGLAGVGQLLFIFGGG